MRGTIPRNRRVATEFISLAASQQETRSWILFRLLQKGGRACRNLNHDPIARPNVAAPVLGPNSRFGRILRAPNDQSRLRSLQYGSYLESSIAPPYFVTSIVENASCFKRPSPRL